MANAWREHVKKTMAEMRSAASDGKVMLKDVLKQAGKTYKKPANSSDSKKTQKKKSTKRRKSAKKRKSVKKRKSAKK